jgi:hypothetical protein
MKRPLKPWLVSLISFAAVLILMLVVVIATAGSSHGGTSDFDNGEKLGRLSAHVGVVIAGIAYFLQRRRVKRFEAQAQSRSV